jgi:hypothetical protein
MKKFLMTLVLGVSVLALTACAELPDGVDQNFHNQAFEIFVEIDDDTMEMDWEGADADDIAKVNTINAIASNEREIQFSESLDKMVELQSAVIDGDRDALREYLKARENAMYLMNFGETGSMDEFTVPTFQFGQEMD